MTTLRTRKQKGHNPLEHFPNQYHLSLSSKLLVLGISRFCSSVLKRLNSCHYRRKSGISFKLKFYKDFLKPNYREQLMDKMHYRLRLKIHTLTKKKLKNTKRLQKHWRTAWCMYHDTGYSTNHQSDTVFGFYGCIRVEKLK